MDDQQEVIAFLADPANHGQVGPVSRLETHISQLFLVGKLAYKLMRAVTLPFVDFSKLTARRLACEAELAINRRFAPRLYRRVRAIGRRADGRLGWDRQASAVDWVVEMNRFEQEQLFDRLAEQGAVDQAMLRDLADMVVRMHQGADIKSDDGGSAGIARVVAGNESSFRRFVPQIFAADEIDRLQAETRAALDRAAPFLERRRSDGKVRRCHGDLHLGNICLIDGKPVPFDAIGFNEGFACIDLFYDLAFLLMDLEERGLKEGAALLLSRYLAATLDIDGLASLPLFLSLRAAIRAHVGAAMGKAPAAHTYLARALAFLRPPPPRLVAIGGFSGSGKSLLARRLAPFLGGSPGALVLRSDLARKYLLGVTPETHLPDAAYDEQVTAQVYRGLLDHAEQALRAGQAVIVDAVSARPCQRDGLAALANRLGVPFTGLWLESDRAVMAERLQSRGESASDATVEVLDRQLAADFGVVNWHRLDSSIEKEQSLRCALALVSKEEPGNEPNR